MKRPTQLKLLGHVNVPLPMVWLGQSVRTTVVTRRYPEFANESWMVSLGDAIHRPRLIEKVFKADIRQLIGVKGPLMLDSGGFTMMANKRGMRAREILEIYAETQAELCITLDVPPVASDTRHKRSSKYRRTLENLELLVNNWDHRRIVPVVHGVTVREVERNCADIVSLLPLPRVVCVGGLVPLLRHGMRHPEKRAESVAWIRTLVEVVRQQFPRSVIHILGAGSPQNVATAIVCGADSTDSLAWRRAAGFGAIYLPGTSERFLAPRNRQRENSRRTISKNELALLEACRCPACAEWPKLKQRVKGLSESYLARAAHNASIVLAQARSK